jgi:hypothetical protein
LDIPILRRPSSVNLSQLPEDIIGMNIHSGIMMVIHAPGRHFEESITWSREPALELIHETAPSSADTSAYMRRTLKNAGHASA